MSFRDHSRWAMLSAACLFACVNAYGQTAAMDFASVEVELSEVGGSQEVRLLIRDAATAHWYGSNSRSIAAPGFITYSAAYDFWMPMATEDEAVLNAFAGADERPVAFSGTPELLSVYGVTQIDGIGFQILGSGRLAIQRAEFRTTPFATSGPALLLDTYFPFDYTIDGDYTPNATTYPFGERQETLLPVFMDDTRTTTLGNCWGGYAAEADHLQMTQSKQLRFRIGAAGSYVYTLFGKGPLGGDPGTDAITAAEADFVCDFSRYMVLDGSGISCVSCPSFGATCADGIHAREGYYIYSDIGGKSAPLLDEVIDGTVMNVGPQGYTFGGAPMVGIRIAYPDADQNGIVDGTGIPEGSIVLFRVDPLTDEVIILHSTIDTDLNEVTADTEALGIFGLASPGFAPVPESLPVGGTLQVLLLVLPALGVLCVRRRYS
ncbi:MAG: hypothetical protein GC168_01045 [Candidatus Hydrogenedens sp.]|nr:hypothetical protein [Candidatus Hydrogenedens sp.]